MCFTIFVLEKKSYKQFFSITFFLLYSYSLLLFGAWSIKIQIKNTRIVIYDAFKEKKIAPVAFHPMPTKQINADPRGPGLRSPN